MWGGGWQARRGAGCPWVFVLCLKINCFHECYETLFTFFSLFFVPLLCRLNVTRSSTWCWYQPDTLGVAVRSSHRVKTPNKPNWTLSHCVRYKTNFLEKFWIFFSWALREIYSRLSSVSENFKNYLLHRSLSLLHQAKFTALKCSHGVLPWHSCIQFCHFRRYISVLRKNSLKFEVSGKVLTIFIPPF